MEGTCPSGKLNAASQYMKAETTETLRDDPAGIDRACAHLKAGRLVAFPTETVYGLAADARNGAAVASIYAAKERPRFNPLIVHIPDLESAQRIGTFNDNAAELAQAFWPGPLSLVVPLRENHGLSDLVTAGLKTVALRVPSHPFANTLLNAFSGPLAAPSANPSGRISPTCAEHVMAGLDGRIAAVLDGGACAVGLESTIIDPGPPVRQLRSGGVAEEAIAACLNAPLLGPKDGPITSPGQMTSHYAPTASMRLNATRKSETEVHLGFGEIQGDLSLSTTGDLLEAAANLFGCLHELDADGRPIAVAPIPEHGLGQAINDRLQRAAAPRG